MANDAPERPPYTRLLNWPAVVAASAPFGVTESDLFAVIAHESGGRWDAVFGSATGWIGFSESTLATLNMTRRSYLALGPEKSLLVIPQALKLSYDLSGRRPFKGPVDLALAVFYPGYRPWAISGVDVEFPSEVINANPGVFAGRSPSISGYIEWVLAAHKLPLTATPYNMRQERPAFPLNRVPRPPGWVNGPSRSSEVGTLGFATLVFPSIAQDAVPAKILLKKLTDAPVMTRVESGDFAYLGRATVNPAVTVDTGELESEAELTRRSTSHDRPRPPR